jgi:hypothetical protein
MGIIGNAPSLTVGGRVFTDLQNLIIIRSHTAIAANYATPRRSGASAGYTPSGANKFRIVAVRLILNNSTSDTYLSYADNDSGVNTATTPTNEVFWGGNQQLAPLSSSFGVTAEPKFEYEIAHNLLIPNGKYIQTFASCDATFEIYGYEEA